MKNKNIYIAGHNGMVGSAVYNKLKADGYKNLITKSHSELDLINQNKVDDFFTDCNPDYVIVAAAKVGGILANNTYRADFIYDNLMIACNIINSSHRVGVKKLIFLGSSCIYPKNALQPMKEESLLTDILEFTNEPYAIAKISGIKLCENYFRQYGSNFYSLMPTNLYGPNDNYNLETSHVLPALIRKIHEAKINNSTSVVLWGSGKPLREFLYADDLAEAVVYSLENIEADQIYNLGISHLNVGSGKEISIEQLAILIKKIIGFKGEITYDKTKPDGTLRKLMDNSRINKLGWEFKTELEEGIRLAYDWYLKTLK